MTRLKSNISDKNYKFKSQGQKSRQYEWQDYSLT